MRAGTLTVLLAAVCEHLALEKKGLIGIERKKGRREGGGRNISYRKSPINIPVGPAA